MGRELRVATDPICGMYVDERTATLRWQRDNRTYYFCGSSCLAAFRDPEHELRDLRRLLLAGSAATAVILLLTYVVSVPENDWVLTVLGTAVQVALGRPFYAGTIDALRSRVGNMDVLVAAGTTAAWAYSLAVVVAPGRLPASLYFDASAAILTFILAGNYLERTVRARASAVLDRIRELVPAQAHLRRGGELVDRPVDEVRFGDRVVVRPGERVPVDGTVLAGTSELTESLLTGEPLPRPVAAGSTVVAGAVNGSGALDIGATGTGENTFLAHVAELVREAESSRIPLQRLADRLAERFVPFVLLLGVGAALGWDLIGHAPAGTTVLVFVSVVITACPCAFGLATPAALVVGTGRAAEEGVLFRGGDAIERAAVASVVLTDKTGTLTRGAPTLRGAWPAPEVSEADLGSAAATVEADSEHPLANAVRAAATARGWVVEPDAASESLPGLGVRGRWRGRTVEVVRADPGDLSVQPSGESSARPVPPDAASVSWSVVRADGRRLGLLEFTDEPMPHARAAVDALRADGLEVVMVTGDRELAARAVADPLGIREVRSSVSPGGKLAMVREYQSRGLRVAFVGDGVNDAAALAAADVGIAVGTGTDVAKEAGQVVLLRGDPRGIALALRLARRTVAKVRQNLIWAIGYNVVLLPIAAGALVFVFGFGVYRVLPFLGAIAMAFSSTLVVTNSLALGWVHLDPPAAGGSARKA